MSQFTDEERELLEKKLKYVREQESKYGKIGLDLRGKFMWMTIAKNIFSASLGSMGFLGLIGNFMKGDVLNCIASGVSLTAGVYNIVVDGLSYDVKLTSFLKSGLQFHHMGNYLESLLVDDEINKEDILKEVNDRIKDIENASIPL